MAYALRLSKAGYSAATETDPNNMVFDSAYDTLKYYSSGSIDVEVAGATAEGEITHNLGYVPFFTAYTNYYGGVTGAEYNMCPGVFQDAGAYVWSMVYADTTKLYFKVFTGSANQTFTFKYKIFRNNTGL